MKQLLRFLFPPLCWHCEEQLKSFQPLCPSCIQLLELAPYQSPLFAFEGQGPIWSLIKALKSGQAPRLAKGLAGYMVMQYLQSQQPLPDLIVPVPQSLSRAFQVGYNPAYLLAQEVGRLLHRPVVNLLKRRGQWVQQMRVDKERRRRLSSHQFLWKRKIDISGKRLLLIDDVIGTGATLWCCVKRLKEGLPQHIIPMAVVSENPF